VKDEAKRSPGSARRLVAHRSRSGLAACSRTRDRETRAAAAWIAADGDHSARALTT
jgi:hypothetical protein